MAYTNTEQIFMDVLGGRSPSPSEQKQIDALLAILMRAGFVVDEPSNAAHVTMLAWGWARETGRNDVLAALHGNRQDMDTKITAIHQGIERQLGVIDMVRELKDRPQPSPSVDTDRIAAALIKAMPPPTASIKVDTSLLKDAVMESVSKLWLLIAGVGLVVFFWAGMEWAQHQLAPVIEQLHLQNQQLINKLANGHHAH
ncbi:hypothetical protein [Ferrovum myxofaciens]|uniref:hypothetical protein n=1 Tax=Ferrovum myxofaciens TaxID=416213 RepID=UPI0004E0CB7B|nr:hypothetical protein [Ferrovum myxofaciens]